MASAAELMVRISADLKDFEKKMGSFSGKLKEVGKNVTAAGTNMTKYITLPAVAAGGAIFALAAKTGEYADRILDLNAITGMTTDTIQEWQHVSRIAGVNLEAVTHATEGLVRRLPQLEAEGGRVTEQLKKLGFNFEDLSAMSPDQMMDALIGSLAGMEDVLERNAIGSQMFGGAWKDLAPILALGAEGIEAARLEAHALGAVMGEEALHDANNFRIEMEKLKAEFAGFTRGLAGEAIPILRDQLLPVIREQILPAIERFIQFIGRLVTWYQNLSPEMQRVVNIFIALFVAMGPVLVVVGKIITVLGAVLTPVGLVVMAIVGLIAIFVCLWNTNEEFRDRVIAVFQKVKEFIGNAIEFIQNIITTVLEYIHAFWDKWGADIMGFVTSTFYSIRDIVKQVIELVLIIVQFVLNRIRQIWDKWGGWIMAYWTFLWETIKNVLTTAWDLLKSTVQGALQIISGILDVFIGLFTGNWERMWNGLGKVVKGAANIIIGLINGILGAIERMVNGLGNAINRIPKFKVPKWVPGLGGSEFGLPSIPRVSLPRIPKLQTGTNFVPEDMLAFLHKGEAVVPKKFNPGAGGSTRHEHYGTIRVEGVNNSGELVASMDWIMNNGKMIAKATAPFMDEYTSQDYSDRTRGGIR